MTAGVNAPRDGARSEDGVDDAALVEFDHLPRREIDRDAGERDLEIFERDVAKVFFKELTRLVEAKKPVGADGIDVERRDLESFKESATSLSVSSGSPAQ